MGWLVAGVGWWLLLLVLTPAYTEVTRDHSVPSWGREIQPRRQHPPEATSTPSDMSSRRAWWEEITEHGHQLSQPTTNHYKTSHHPIRDNLGYTRHTSQYGRRVAVRDGSLYGLKDASRRTTWPQYATQHNLRTPNQDSRLPHRRVENYLSQRGHIPTGFQASYWPSQHEGEHSRGFKTLHPGQHDSSGGRHYPHNNRASTQHQQSTIPQHHRQPHNDHRQPHIDHRQPRNDHRHPNSDHRQPHSDLRQPHKDHRQPHNDHRLPHNDLRQPHNDHRQPHNDHRQPHNDHRQPHNDLRQPHNDLRQPHNDHRQPHNDLRQPHNDHRQLLTGHHQPHSDHSESHSDHWQSHSGRREVTAAKSAKEGQDQIKSEETRRNTYTAHRPLHSSGGHRRPPNIVLIMTDDQDVELGSLNYMPSLMSLMKDRGAYFPNAYCSTPICCPSRSSMLTGLYIHNHEVYTNNHNCSSQQWQDTHERRSFATYLSAAGYRTGYFGKYLNKYNGSHIPAGWQEWSGLIKNSRYYNYTVQRNGHFIKYGDHYPKDYYPHVITNEGIQFLEKNKAQDSPPPMLLVLSYPAPHGPEDSAPEHAHRFFNASDHNTMAYNYAPNPDKQWLLQFIGRMHDIELKFTDLLMTKRLQTLQTIDESVAKVVNALEVLGELNNTYIFYTSDHGYHLGQFGLVKGKSMPFEFDIKVPFLVRGPGIEPGRQINNIALNVDLAPTFLDIAGIKPPLHMDGRSLLPVLTNTQDDDSRAVPWRDSFLVESAGRHREEDALKLREERRQLRAQGLIGSGVNGGLYTSKRERLEIICKSEEYRSPCKADQKWECVHEGYRWRLHKCRHGKARGSKSRWRQRNCVCEPDLGMGYLVKLDSAERRKQRTFLKKHVTQDLRDYGAKFIKVFTDVDSRELLEQSLGTQVQLNSLLAQLRKIRTRRSTPEDMPVGTRSPGYEGDHEDVVDTFVIEEEIRDIDVTIDSLYDELESLENVSSSTVTSDAAANVSALAASPTDLTPVDIRHGCRVTGTSVDCTDNVYHDPHAWRLSKVAIDQQIRRLRHQLFVMKDIRKHLQDSRPDSVTDEDDSVTDIDDSMPDVVDYEEYADEREASGDFDLIIGESDADQDDDNTTSASKDPSVFDNAYSTEDEDSSYNDTLFNSSEHHGEEESYTSEESDTGSDDEDGDIIIGRDYDMENERHDISNEDTSHMNIETLDNDQTIVEESEPVLRLPGGDSYHQHHGSKQFQLFPVRQPTPHQRQPPTINNETTARSRCWCDKSFRLEIKQAERQRKREERLKLRQERQRVKLERRLLKEKKKMRKLKNNLAQCNYTMLNCYTHDNDHWRTPPLWHDGKFCFCMNAANNTYWCVRTINETHNFLYCEFVTGLVTYYDLNIDPYQLRNVAFTLSNKRLAELHHRLETLRTCSGANQCDDLPGSQDRHNESNVNIQDIEDMEREDISNRVDLIVPSRPVMSRSQLREERRRVRKERDRQREERRRRRKEQKKWRRSQLFESKGRHVLHSIGSDRGIVRLRRKSRTEERRRLKKERRDRRRERRRKKPKRDKILLSE